MCVTPSSTFVLILRPLRAAPAMGVTGAAGGHPHQPGGGVRRGHRLRPVEQALPLGPPDPPAGPGIFCPPSQVLQPPWCSTRPCGAWAPPCSRFIMGHMANSQDMLAAYALIGNIDKLSTVSALASPSLLSPPPSSSAREIGRAGNMERVYSVGWTLLVVSLLVGALVMPCFCWRLLPLFFRPVLFRLFKGSPPARRRWPDTWPCLRVFKCPCGPSTLPNIPACSGRRGCEMPPSSTTAPLWLASIPWMGPGRAWC